MKFWSLVLVTLLAFGSLDADAARRLGGGGSVGRQSSNVTQRQATTPATPGTAQSANAAKPTPAPAAPAVTPPRRPWGAMLGGLAAGLGLAWLAHSLGLGGAFGNILMFALLAMAVMMVIGYFVRRRSAAGQPPMNPPYAFQGAGAESAQPVPQYSPDKVGNDASARPWERNNMAFDSAKSGTGTGVQIGSALGGSQNWGVPPDFDTDGFLAAAKRNFVTLQDAWDRSDVNTLRSMMTDDMLGEIRSQMAEREGQPAGASTSKTEVAMLEAKLLGIEDLGDGYMASVEFSGMIREEPSAGPSPFREVWNMTKPKSGHSGWLVAGVQALQ